MTKKDYVRLAEAIYKMTFPVIPMDSKDYHEQLRKRVADRIGEALAKENYRFDWKKWDDYIFPEAVWNPRPTRLEVNNALTCN